MFKKLLFLAITLLGLTTSFAQVSDISKELITLNEKRKRGTIAETINYQDHLYILYTEGLGRRADIILKKFTNDLELVKEFEIEIDDKKEDIYRLVEFGDKLLLLTQKDDTKENIIIYNTYEVNTSNLSLGTGKTLITFPYKNNRNKFKPDVKISQNDEFLLFIGDKEDKKEDKSSVLFWVMDKNLEQAWEYSFEVEHDPKYLTLYDYMIDNDGNVFYVVKHKSTVREEKRVYDYTLYNCKFSDKSTSKNLLSMGEEFISDLKISVWKEQDLNVTGFYSNEQYGEVNGVFFGTLDKETSQLEIKGKKDISVEVLKQGESEKTKKKIDRKKDRKNKKGKELELASFDIKDIINKEDGGVVMIAERSYSYTTVTTRTDPNTGATTTTTTVHFVNGNIIVVDISPEGVVNWTHKIRKYQHESNSDYGGSYALLVAKNKLYFVFNDHVKNHDVSRKVGDLYNANFGKKKGVATIYELNEEGNALKDILYSNKELNGILIPKFSSQTGKDNGLIIFAPTKKGNKAVIINRTY